MTEWRWGVAIPSPRPTCHVAKIAWASCLGGAVMGGLVTLGWSRTHRRHTFYSAVP
jgi:hypothetical protein